MPTFSTPSPCPLHTFLGVVRKQQRNTTLVGKSEFPRAPRQTEVLGCWERLGGQEQWGPDKDGGPETSWDCRYLGDAGSRCRGWKAVGMMAFEPMPGWTEVS